MVMSKDFIPNKLSFDYSGCMDMIKRIIDVQLDTLSLALQLIVGKQIADNGNGSGVMKLDAIANVRETKREVTNDHIKLEVGIDLEELKGKNEDLFVRVSVVLHGNMKGDSWTWRDARVMYTKPGVATYGKNVTNKRVHVPEGHKPRELPGFAQPNVIDGIIYNTEKMINRYVDDFMRIVTHDVENMNWSAFLIVR